MRKSHLLAFITVLVLFTGCFRDNDPPSYQAVEGVVLSGGQPVPGAQIHILNYFDPGGFVADTLNVVDIRFEAPNRTLYTGNMFHHAATTVRNTFLEDTLAAGPQTITIPDSLLTNGIFGYEVRTPISILTSSLFLITKPDSLLPGVTPFTVTGAGGNFELNSDYLALGRVFNTPNGASFQVGDSLQIIVTDDEQVLSVDKVQVKPNQANFFEINLD